MVTVAVSFHSEIHTRSTQSHELFIFVPILSNMTKNLLLYFPDINQ